MNRHTIGVAVLCLLLASCTEKTVTSTPSTPAVPQAIPESAIDTLLLTPSELNKVMGTTTLVGKPPASQMDDHRNLLPNLNCLGVWQIDESAIYGKTYTAVRKQTLRAPDIDQWDSLVAQSVIYYPKADAAREFFDESTERWSKCANHHVNITLNGQKLPKWSTGQLGRTDAELAMPITRGVGDQARSCQHVLRLVTNLVIDVEACISQPPVSQGATIAEQIAAGARTV
jgi:PknH-like extracellular domain